MAGITGFGGAPPTPMTNFQSNPITTPQDPFAGLDLSNVYIKIIEQPASNRLRFR